MRPTPIPDEAIWEGARRMVIAPPDGDLTSTDIAPVEALVDVGQDTGIPRISVRCVLEEGDLDKLKAGGTVWIGFYGGQLIPFCVDVVGPNGE
jgi:hypothetical protein